MTGEELEAIREACENATEGPWSACEDGDDTCAVLDRDRGTFAYLSDEWLADAEFIAGSREWVPALLDECERLRQTVRDVDKAWRSALVDRALPAKELAAVREAAGLAVRPVEAE